MTVAKPSYFDRARERWGAAMPEFVGVLARAADAAPKLAPIAQRTGLRPDVISGIIGKTYPGKLDKIEAMVRGALMSATVECPALGTAIGRDLCAGNQGRKFSAANPQLAKFPRACKGCPNAIGGEG